MLDPYVWLQNTVIPFPMKSAMETPQPSQSSNVDQAKVDRATSEWRRSRYFPQEGNHRFFIYALKLRSAGMSCQEIEGKLCEEAQFGRLLDERQRQISSIMKSLRSSRKAASPTQRTSADLCRVSSSICQPRSRLGKSNASDTNRRNVFDKVSV
jgi:hypothetical protein